MNSNEIKGRVKRVKGAAKEAAGRLTGRRKLQVKGRIEKLIGTAQTRVGEAERHAQEGRRARDIEREADRVEGDV